MAPIFNFFETINPIYAAFMATLFTWALTALGASLVFFFKKINRGEFDMMLGFTGGVMVAPSSGHCFHRPSGCLKVRMFLNGFRRR